jgi:twitching motility protein PilT
MQIIDLLNFARQNKASDLHLSSGNPPIVRIYGDILPMNLPPLSPDQVKTLLYSMMSDAQRTQYERELELDFAVSFGAEMRFRVNAFNTLVGPAVAMRDIPTRVLSLDELKAPDIFKRLTTLKKGLILVTGPTGSGKSTTLAAIIDHMNAHHNHHILTIEDPIEFVHHSKRSLINQREVGSSTKSFAAALKSALREDPDIILVGEMRDLETISLALTAAETGHLVLGTLHTNSAPKTIDRIIDVFPAADKEMVRSMIAGSLEAIITQNLLKKADGSGRVAVHEILLGTPAVRNLIRENKIPQLVSLMQMGSKLGMQTMKDCVHTLLEQGTINEEAARALLATQGEPGAEDTKTPSPSAAGTPPSAITRPPSTMRAASSGSASGF